MKIALAGNPNSGKTTLYNALTGKNEKTGNWAGVTVDRREHAVKKSYCKEEKIIAVDLPGAYSISPFTSEESITSEYVKNENPDVIINVVDSTSLNRSLFFTTQLLELGIPIVVALNKSDINKKRNTNINCAELSKRLACAVVEVSATSKKGLSMIIKKALELQGKKQSARCYQGIPEPHDGIAAKEIDKRRFDFVNNLVLDIQSTSDSGYLISDKIDEVITNKWLGIPIFAVVMFLVFQISQVWIGTPMADLLVTLLESFQGLIGNLLSGASPLLYALLVDGIIGGAIAVIGFLPLVMVMYFLIALLEDCGYMSRVAVLLDPIFKRVGLSGKSVIPFVITVGCAVPGIMASRTIKNERERRATAMLAPFMPCGAKIPVISLFAGAFFDNAGWVSTVMYLSGILLIFIGAFIINKITAYSTKKSFFIVELPEYKLPSVWDAFKTMCARGKSYIVKAATIILLCNTAVQIMQSFDLSFRAAESADSSILAALAGPFAYLLVPIVGVLSWQLAAAAVTGFIAKENVVGTLAVCFIGLENLIDTEELALISGSGEQAAGIIAITKVAALAYLMFNLYTPPCFAAIGAMNAEMKSAKWLWAGIVLQLGVGYTIAYLVYTMGTLIVSPASLNAAAAIAGGIAVAAFAGVITYLMLLSKKKASI